MKKIVVIVGPTATGKSKIAIELAKTFDGEIISADSMQVYKNMDIGTSKISPEEAQGIPHHLIDVVDIKEPFSAAEYQNLARKSIESIRKIGKLPILVGGTGLYVRAAIDKLEFPEGRLENKIRKQLELELKEKGIEPLFSELEKADPQAAESIDKHNHRRVIRALEVFRITGQPFSNFQKNWENFKTVYPTIIIGLKLQRDELYDRINKRVDEMIEKGFLEETKKLTGMSLKKAIVSKQAIGYKELIDYLDGNTNFDEAINNLKKRTRNYAKRQVTWFKKDPRIKWVDSTDINIALKEIKHLIKNALA